MLTHCKLAPLVLLLVFLDHGYAGLIIGGRVAAPHSRPYMALVERHTSDGVKKYCSGFLLSEDFVMTAAHCQAKTYIVRLGLHDVHDNDGVQSVTVEQAYPRNDYNASTSRYLNDVMLLKLSSKAQINEKVEPIGLAGRDDGSLPKSCIVSGWGKYDNTGLMSSVLREINITLIDNRECQIDNFYCSEGKAGPYGGDSGSPLVCDGGKAYGVMSSQFIPASGGPPVHRFAKIPDQRKWIVSTIKSSLKY